MISYGKQDISASDLEAVMKVLKSDFLTQGPAIDQFEQALSDYCQVSHAVAFCNATAALHAAYQALGIGPGKLVWTSPVTFVSTANAALMLGADVDFVDINPVTYNMSVEALESKLLQAKADNKLPDLVAPVHLTGQSCDMAAIHALSKQYGFKIVEDAAHAIGGQYKDKPVGSCDYSDITIFSFHPVKIVTTGEGGAAMTNSPDLAQKMHLFRSHGITRDANLMQNESQGGWYYEMLELGYNYRMTDIQAALGVSQMERLDQYVARRHEIAALYDERFADTPIVTPHREDWQYSGFHLYVIGWPEGTGGMDRKAAFEALRESGIGVNVHYMPVHLQPHYRKLGFKRGDFPQAEAYYDQAITIPLFPTMTDEQIDCVANTVIKLAAK